ncbi:MAG TPA: ADP-ribosylglycohydrolase family protein [Syntrophomonadaceae bacterium]|nr:ADP-ribosylglycohydrolase family protein [Syntrophomonadaceae bacterium]
MDLFNKAHGTMVGLACGDALGALAEHIPLDYKSEAKTISQMVLPLPLEKLIPKAENEKSLNRLQDYINHMPLPGLYTDDTQEAMLLALSLINNKGINPRDIADLFIQAAKIPGYSELGIFRQAGPGFKQVIKNLMIYKPLNTAGVISAGNGAAMRISPLGVYYNHDIDILLLATIKASMITHRDIRGIAAAGIIAYTVAYSLNKSGDTFEAGDLIYNLKLFVRELENIIIANYNTIQYEMETKHQISDAINIISDISNLDYEKATARLDKLARKTSNVKNSYHNSPFALGSVFFSLYIFISQGGEPKQAILTAVNAGGDADTIGAMVGTMCGALHGYEKIPVNWRDSLCNMEILREVGTSLITGLPINVNLIDIEKDWCKKEILFRNKYRQLVHKALGF